jgi:hypothetical protein
MELSRAFWFKGTSVWYDDRPHLRELTMDESKQDPTKDPQFQKVVRHFVTTPHKPHERLGSASRKKKATSGAGRCIDDYQP